LSPSPTPNAICSLDESTRELSQLLYCEDESLQTLSMTFFLGICFAFLLHQVSSLSLGAPNDVFSLASYHKARAKETQSALDASRLHFQVLIIDSDNTLGRITEGLLARTSEYNDAMFSLFSSSCTVTEMTDLVDATPSDDVVAICESLGLCSTASSEMGSSFELSYLDEYDLLVCLDDDIRNIILRSLPSEDQDYYAKKTRLLSEFLSADFCCVASDEFCSLDSLVDMLDADLRERVEPHALSVMESSSNIFSFAPVPRVGKTDDTADWELVETALVCASAGVARFCLDVLSAQLDESYTSLLQRNFYRREHLNIAWETAYEQLQRCSSIITGSFSPKEQKKRYEDHVAQLKMKFGVP